MEYLGSGVSASVFRLAENKVVKIFEPHLGSILAEREFFFAKLAFNAGIQTPEPIELGEHESKAAIFYAFCSGTNLDKHTLPRPWRYQAASRELADIQADINRLEVPATPKGGPEVVEQRDLLSLLAGYVSCLPNSLLDECHKRIEGLPRDNKLCHGDMSPSNVMLESKKCIAIDWSLASVGSPIGDVAMTWIGVGDMAQSSKMPTLIKRILKSGAESYLQRYAYHDNSVSQENLKYWRVPVAAARLGAIEKVGGKPETVALLKTLVTKYCESEF